MASPVRNSAKRVRKSDKTGAETGRTTEQKDAFTAALKAHYARWCRTSRAFGAARKTLAFVNAMNDAAADLKLNPSSKETVDDRTLRSALAGDSFPQFRTFRCFRKVLFPGVTEDGTGEAAEVAAWQAFTQLWYADGTPPRQDIEIDADRDRSEPGPPRKKPALSDDAPAEFSINWKQTRLRPFDDELVDFRLHPPLPSNQPGDRHDILATLEFGTVTHSSTETGTVIVALRAAHLNIPAASYQVAMNKMPGQDGNNIPGFTRKTGGAIIRPKPGAEYLDGSVVPGGRLTELEPGPDNAGPVSFIISAARQDIHVEAAAIEPGSTREQWAARNREKALKVLILDKCQADSSGRPVLAQVSLERKPA